jgi:hypothetical protein
MFKTKLMLPPNTSLSQYEAPAAGCCLQVTESSWFAEFQSDVRQRLSTNFSSSLRGLRMGAAGTAEWTQRTIIRTATTSFRYATGLLDIA